MLSANVFLKIKCKQNIWKSRGTFWEKNSSIPEKENWSPKRVIYHWQSWRRAYHWGLKEDPKKGPITEKSKEDLSLRNLKRTLSPRTLKKTLSQKLLKKNPSSRTLKEPYHWGPLMTFTPQKPLFDFFFIMVYDRVGDENKFS